MRRLRRAFRDWVRRGPAPKPDYSSMRSFRESTHKGMGETQFPGDSGFQEMANEANDRYGDSFNKD